jgi:uncharacterized protein (DUF885 family)
LALPAPRWNRPFVSPESQTLTYSTEPLPHFVDDYLSYLHETCPTRATFDGVHLHDDLLEDMSRSALDAQVRELGGFARRLAAIDPGGLTPLEKIERPIIEANIQARLFELEDVRTWERHPGSYGELLGASLAGQALFEHAPVEERARRVLSKLRQAPRFLQAARENVKDAPGIFLKVGLETLRGTLKFIEDDLPRAFSDVDDLHLLGDLADAATEAASAIQGYIVYLETDVAPRARASFRLGRGRFERKLRLEEGVTLGADALLAIASRELQATQDEFRKVAARVGPGDPVEVWRKAKAQHPAAGELVQVAREQVGALLTFLERSGLVSVPAGEPVVVGSTPKFYRWTFASMWTPGPFEAKATRAYYYVTDVDPSWPDERKEEHLRDFNLGALWSISMHEVYPGHFLHDQHLRRLESKLRKSIMFAPASFVEGWAHYGEQLMLEAGFGRGDDLIRLGQLAEALIRLARFVVCIRLHAEDFSVEQGVRFFREEAFLEESSARREAERGTFDPTYLVYAVGKLMLLKLRSDCEARQAGRFSLRSFHDTLLRNGTVPFKAHRQLMLGEDGALLE